MADATPESAISEERLAGMPRGMIDEAVANAGVSAYVAASASPQHASDCSVHNAPALPVGPCDCALSATAGTVGEGPIVLPAEMTPAIEEALGIMLWHSGSLCRAYRQLGFEIPNKAEKEQAFVLWRTIRFAAQHGDKWREVAQQEITDLRAMTSPSALSANGGK